ncbi:hypothetical protein BBR47_06460 [Brevibacillus brevis NBRC 100599]|uniref:Uncharacterized protein n=1 Tax=Brevibacillus brevis (strain 47 / JCM 6285 / NBRC 100599) TaxID=358681 RepID=C0Z496_BREBN|nr:hypothetical protein BBR47_06460 [Brevibacillus brevis NBRC 100599]
MALTFPHALKQVQQKRGKATGLIFKNIECFKGGCLPDGLHPGLGSKRVIW